MDSDDRQWPCGSKHTNGQIESLRRRFPEKQYVSDEEFLFFGERLKLDVVWTWTARARVQANESRLELLAPVTSTREERRQAMQVYFKKQARLHIAERVEFFAGSMGLFPKQISIRGQRTRWGSCSPSGEISLNWKLLAAPLAVIDYVVVHELAHMRHMNHSRDFWHLVERFQPTYKTLRRWLKDHEIEIGNQFQASPKAAR